jgi:D-amino peptidase
MKIMLMTDLEGVAGVKNWIDWCRPESRNYDVACRLLTGEANAAVDGFFAAGAEYVQVIDGHGPGGIDIEKLDPRVEYARGWSTPAWPFMLDATFDGVAWVGQHAKASTAFAHLAHTQDFSYIDLSINGRSIGELGQFAMAAAELGVPGFFAAGDLALTWEAEALMPGIVTCAVKRGVIPGTGEECTHKEYGRRNEGAIHTVPARARELIREAAERAARRLKEEPPPCLDLHTPFERVAVFRPEEKGEPRTTSRESHSESVIDLLGMPFSRGQELGARG